MTRTGVAVLLALALGACGPDGPGIQVDNARLVLASPSAPAGAVYMDIRNTGPEADRLAGVASTAAARAELHVSMAQGDMMTMQQAPDGFEIAPGETLSLAPGGAHVMLMGLSGIGDEITLDLRFDRAGEMTLTIPVQVGAHQH